MLLSVNDLVTGRVEPARLVSHGFLLAGYLIVVALSRPRLRPDGPPARAAATVGLAPDRATSGPDRTPALRVVPPYPGSARARDRPAA